MNRITIHEITPRDGLQNIDKLISTKEKLTLIQLIVDSGATEIESTAFVSPKWVPQMVDASEISLAMAKYPQVVNSVLVPNLKGLYRAQDTGVHQIVGVISASEIHNQANLNKTIQETLSDLKDIAKASIASNIIPRVNIATAFGYLEPEPIGIDQVLELCMNLSDMGFSGITLCDTTGVANPERTFSTCKNLMEKLNHLQLAVHFHQYHGIEFANTYAAYLAGIRHFEAAAGGLGGCPYAKGAEGNIATEYLVKMFNSMGVDCGLDLEKIIIAADYAKKLQLLYAQKKGCI